MILISNKDKQTHFLTLSSQLRRNIPLYVFVPVWTTGTKASDSGSTTMYKITGVFTLIGIVNARILLGLYNPFY